MENANNYLDVGNSDEESNFGFSGMPEQESSTTTTPTKKKKKKKKTQQPEEAGGVGVGIMIVAEPPPTTAYPSKPQQPQQWGSFKAIAEKVMQTSKGDTGHEVWWTYVVHAVLPFIFASVPR